MASDYNLITASGTFDRLHKGHKAFLKQAFELSRKVAIGITSDAFAKSKQYSDLIEPFETRKAYVVAFLKKNSLLKRAAIFSLDDIYGPTVDKHAKIEAVLVTEKTIAGAQEINVRRGVLGLKPLAIIKTELVKTKNGEAMSSFSDRRSFEVLNQTLLLPGNVRQTLKKPTGMLLEGSETHLQTAVGKAKQVIATKHPFCIITVGDVVTKSFNEAGIPIQLAIVDFKIKREETVANLSELGFIQEAPDATVENLPGTISKALSETIARIFQHMKGNDETRIIRVFGEEDLAVLPVIIFAPNGSLIAYGQPREGIVVEHVDSLRKRSTIRLLNRFTAI